jgi:UPF0271 protein
MVQSIDLNSDIGELESDNNDHLIVKLVSSVNICCGVHAGSTKLTRKTIKLAAKSGVSIGAHPGMPGGFGRSDEPIEPQAAYTELLQQLEEFTALAGQLGVQVSHVKPHGALYNQAETNTELAKVIVNAVQTVVPYCVLYGLAGGNLLSVAHERGLHTIGEFFADRAYDRSGNLVPRSIQGSVIDSVESVCLRTVQALETGIVIAIDGTPLKLNFETICVHGDTNASVQMIERIKEALDESMIIVEPPS